MGAGGDDDVRNREGWAKYLAEMQPAIARHDASRAPIDLIGRREAGFRCIGVERADYTGPALSAFEKQWCARPELQDQLKALREAWGLPARPVSS